MDEVELAEFAVTCHTQGCENEGIEITVMAVADNPTVVCGPCGADITPQ